jgi:hypothetical protein
VELGEPQKVARVKIGMKASNPVDLQEVLFHEVEVVQGIIGRLAGASFLIKGWSVTLIVAILALQNIAKQPWVTIVPILIFWFLDATFLHLEKRYRKLHQWVAQNRLETPDRLFDLDTTRFRSQVSSPLRLMFSRTLLWFYVGSGVLVLAYALLASAFSCVNF